MVEGSGLRLEAYAAEGPSPFATGPFGSSVSARNFRSSGMPMLRGSNLSEDIGVRLDDSEIVYVPVELAGRFSRSIARAGDLVFTCWGTIGQIGLIGNGNRFHEYLVSNKQMKMTPDPAKVSALFLYYYLSQPSMVKLVQGQAIGSSVPGFNLGQLKALPVQLPSLEKQQAIAEVLGSLDDKIAANERQHRLIDEICTAKLAEAVRDVDTAVQLRDVLIFHYGKALPTSHRRLGDVPVYGSGGLTGYHDKSLVASPGIVVGRKGSVGAIHWADGPHYPIDTTYFVEPVGSASSEVLYHLLRNLRLAELNSDSAVPGLNRDEAYAQRVLLPPSAALESLADEFVSRFSLAKVIRAETDRLKETRDGLLPLLISGKVRVRDVERRVEDAL